MSGPQGDLASETRRLQERLGVPVESVDGGLAVCSPVTGEHIATVRRVSAADAEVAMIRVQFAFASWRLTPAPRRGELVRLQGVKIRRAKEDQARLVSLGAELRDVRRHDA